VRIARVLTRLNLGGPARQTLASDPLLRARGHSLRVFCGQPEAGEGNLADLLRARGIEVQEISGLRRRPSPWGDLRAGRALRRALQDFQPDLVHTHASKAGWLGRRAAWALDLPTVHTFHGHVLEGYFSGPVSRLLVRSERRMARRTDQVLAVAHATADDLVRLGVCSEEDLVVVPPGVDLDPFLSIRARSGFLRRQVGAGSADFLVGVVGRLAPVKRPELAIDVFELLCQRHPQLHLVFIGDGALWGNLAQRIENGPPEVKERVHMLGVQVNMVAVMSDLDAVLLTSSNEGAPVCLLEAAASGLPVVASGVGGVPEVVAHERSGWLGENVDEWAFGLDQYLSDGRLARESGQRGRVRVATRHGAAALADRLEAVYRSVLGLGVEAPAAPEVSL
jgi:glycosyltransferase involved in cell wall biosynthesis